MAANDDRGGPRRQGRKPGRSGGRPKGAQDRGRTGGGAARRGDDRSGQKRPERDRHGRSGGRTPAPRVPEGTDASGLDRSVRDALRSLPKELADQVGGHLAAAADLADTDPGAAYEHALAARHRAPRLAVTRETCGIALYRMERWGEAAQELRAARRMGGNDALLPVIADCARGVGDPQRALAIALSPEAAALRGAARAETLMVAAGARRDLGQLDAAVVLLRVPELQRDGQEPWRARLRYAYADALAAADHTDEAREWFARVGAGDAAARTDAAERLAELGDSPDAGADAGTPDGEADEAIVDLAEQ